MEKNFQSIGLIFIAALVFFSAGCGGTVTREDGSPDQRAETAAQKGEKIIAEYLRRDSSPFRKSRVRLTVKIGNGEDEVFVMEVSRKQTANETLTLTEIIEPKEDSNIATLTLEPKDRETVNINYVRSRDQFRESGTNKIFFGGLTSQELLGEWDKYDSVFLGEKEFKGTKVFEVESTLKPKESSVIARIVTLFGADDHLPRELRLYNSDGKELRLFEIEEIRDIGGRKIVSKTQITNHIYNSKITIEVLEMSFPESLPDELFKREHLKAVSSK
ncbi:MAG: outer membrane lipoprotein-sorting protein [Acidobacteria bacterium]|nr:outer membrane lipoprotein-sorting protein [Acidobacteriota bacterium]